MKPTLASALALGCVSAALVATAGNSQAAPTTTSHHRQADSLLTHGLRLETEANVPGRRAAT